MEANKIKSAKTADAIQSAWTNLEKEDVNPIAYRFDLNSLADLNKDVGLFSGTLLHACAMCVLEKDLPEYPHDPLTKLVQLGFQVDTRDMVRGIASTFPSQHR